MSELIHCPFCESCEAQVTQTPVNSGVEEACNGYYIDDSFYRFYVKCYNCGAQGPWESNQIQGREEAIGNAIRRWNAANSVINNLDDDPDDINYESYNL